jgi:hypothetical protein
MVQKLKDPTVGMELNLKNKDDGAAGTGAGILSMLTSIGGMIPSLRKGPQTGELKRIQKGGGAGASLARQTASEAARRVAGNVQGTDLREGLRAAETIVQRGAAQAGFIGARESALATQMLRANEFKRRGAFQTLGAGIGQGLAGIGGMLAAAKDQGEEEQPQGGGGGGGEEEEGREEAVRARRAAHTARIMNVDPITGLPAPPADPFQATAEAGQAGLDQLSSSRQRTLPAGPTQEQAGPAQEQGGPEQPGAESEGVQGPLSSLREATMQKTQAAAEYAASTSTVGEGFIYDPYWGSIAVQLTDRELTPDQARGMLALMGAPPAVIEVMIENAVNGQRHYDLEQAVKANLLRQQAPNRK